MNKQRILSITVNNIAGIINKVTGLIMRKGFSIDSLAVSETENMDVSCMTITLHCDEDEIERAKKQLDTLIDVVEVVELEQEKCIVREHIIIKVKDSLDIRKIISKYHAYIIWEKYDELILEYTGETDIANQLVEEIRRYGILKIVRSGKLAIGE